MTALLKVIMCAIAALVLYLVFPTEDVKMKSVTKSYYNLATNTKSFLNSKDMAFIDEYNQNTANEGDAMMFPVSGTDEFGSAKMVIRHGAGNTVSYEKFHGGVDIGAIVRDTGDTRNTTSILSATSGKVTSAGSSSSMGYYAKVQGDDGFVFTYMHMNETPLVRTGDTVSPGDILGYMGNTGDSGGKHLHFQCEVPASGEGGKILYNPFTLTKLDRDRGGEPYGGEKVKFYFDDKLETIKLPSIDNYIGAHPSYPALGIDDIVPNPNSAYVPEVLEYDGDYAGRQF